MEATDIVSHSKGIASALRSPTGTVGIRAQVPGRDLIGIYLSRINAVAAKQFEARSNGTCSHDTPPLRALASTYLGISRFFFDKAMGILGPIEALER